MQINKGRKGHIAVKLNFEKAFDRIDWSFLRVVLQVIGFEDKFIELILFCTTSASLFVLWNGEQLEAFKPQRGLSQGDPLRHTFLFCVLKF